MTDLAWMIEAKRHVGLREIPGKNHNQTILDWIKNLGGWFKDDETAWCGTYVAHCLKTAGIAYPKHWYRALDYLNYGVALKKPAYGCVAIKTRKGGGHVCFVAGRDKKQASWFVLVAISQIKSVMHCTQIVNLKNFVGTARQADHLTIVMNCLSLMA